MFHKYFVSKYPVTNKPIHLIANPIEIFNILKTWSFDILSINSIAMCFLLSQSSLACLCFKRWKSSSHFIIVSSSLFILFLKNDENPLSVFGLNMRTTSSLESLNSLLGQLIPTRPNIFKFVDGIKIHEFTKHRELLELSFHCPKNQLERKKKRGQRNNWWTTVSLQASF